MPNCTKREAVEGRVDYDVLVIDEWQDMCSNQTCKDYLHIQRKYTIGLSATPIRRKGGELLPPLKRLSSRRKNHQTDKNGSLSGES